MPPPLLSHAGHASSPSPGAARHVLRLLLLLTVAHGPTARAEATPPGEAPLQLEKFEVTGTYIPLATTETALPLKLLDEQAIADTGIATNVLEILRKTAPQFGGNGNIGNSNANADNNSTGGGSKLALRNTQTLVLVNGRRMTYAPILASGGLQFVDVNLIPVSAIERIEVLMDGASATYGTDAVGGVVNIILKTNFEGAEASGRYSVSTNTGHYAERSFALVAGSAHRGTALTVAAEFTRSDPLFQRDRGFSNPSFGTPTFAGVVNTRPSNALPQFYVLNPSLNAPAPGHTDLATLVAQGVYLPVSQFNLAMGEGSERQYAFNLANAVTLLLANERRSATANFEHRVGAGLTVFGDAIYTETRTASQLNAQPLMGILPPANPSNPTTQVLQVRNRFVSRPRRFYYDADSLRVVAGLRGTLGSDFQWEAAADQNVIHQRYTNPNVVDSTLRANAITSGAINLAAREQAPGAIEAAGLFGTAWGRAKSMLTTADARVTGNMLALPAGPLGFGAGTRYRTERLTQTADANSQVATFNWDSAVAINPFEHSRNVASLFAEIRVPLVGEKQRMPLMHALEFGAAVRHERYSDTENPTVPKLSLAWRPVSGEWLLRGTYSESFAAPTLFDLFGPNRADQPDGLVFNQLGGGQILRDGFVRSGSNPNLLPSRSKNWTFGFVWSPKALKGFSVTADAFAIKQRDLISTIDSSIIVQDVELHGAASPYARFVKFGGFDGAPVTKPGALSADLAGDIYVTDTLVNIANQTLRGADVTLEYTHALGTFGRVQTTVALTTYRTFSYQSLPSVASVETVGYATLFNGTIPRWQSNATVAWSRGPWRANAAWQHVPGLLDPQGDGTERRPFAIRAYDAFDLAASYSFDSARRWLKRVTVRVGVNNVFNAQPPLGGGTFTGANADIGTYNPIGRLVFLEAKYRF